MIDCPEVGKWEVVLASMYGDVSEVGECIKLIVVITIHSCGCINIIVMVWFNNSILSMGKFHGM